MMKRRHFGLVQLKIFDSMVWLLRRTEWVLPWMGVSLIVVCKAGHSPS